MNNERCDIEKEASKRKFAKVIASLQEQGDADKILDQLKVRRFICILTKNASVL